MIGQFDQCLVNGNPNSLQWTIGKNQMDQSILMIVPLIESSDNVITQILCVVNSVTKQW